MTKETAAYEYLLCGHLDYMVQRLRHIPTEQFDYTPAPAAPTPRILATHALQWLQCDRAHLSEPDARKHPRIPNAPADKDALCNALAAEIAEWRNLLRTITPEELDRTGYQFNLPDAAMTGRDFVCHMIQNCIYKNGQLATLYFALGLDGTEAYTAPFPNPIYEEVFGNEWQGAQKVGVY